MALRDWSIRCVLWPCDIPTTHALWVDQATESGGPAVFWRTMDGALHHSMLQRSSSPKP